jgi:hypothetical protein
MGAILHSLSGQTILGTTTTSIGNTSDNQLVVNDAGVEPRHAEIRPSGTGYSIVDLGTHSGTFVNDQRLYANVPQQLHNGDAVRIGNTRFSYEGTNEAFVPPTVVASPGYTADSAGAAYAATELAPHWPPATPPAYPSAGNSFPQPGISQSGYGATSYGNPYSSPAAPPPPSALPGYNQYPASAGVPGYMPPQPPVQKSRTGLWITLSIIVLVLVVGVGAIAYIGRGPSTTPTQTLQTYCTAVKAHNAQAAYAIFSKNFQKQYSLDTEKTLVNGASDCAVSNVDDTAKTGIIIYTFPGIGKISDKETLIAENYEWKIDAQQPVQTPTLSLYNYCQALKKGDYKTAYNLYTTSMQKQQGTEQQFAASFTQRVTDCSISNVDDANGKGAVTTTYGALKYTYDDTLTKENGTWKINNEQARSTPTLTLSEYCYNIEHKNYQAAYNLVATDVQAQESESTFASNYGSANISSCSVSNINDTAGTGTITYTFTSGGTAIADYTMVNENGTWKVKSEKVR